jgi:hypothetical protein
MKADSDVKDRGVTELHPTTARAATRPSRAINRL